MIKHSERRYSSKAAELVYGLDPAGFIRHITEVARGLACGCSCPACGRPLIAKRLHATPHFAHQASYACANAPETALHKLAKEIISKERCLVVPEVKAEFRGDSKLIHNRQQVHFDLVCEEAQHLPNLVPDLYVECGDRPLLIEIYVTHACDELKLNSLLELGIAAVEIDLSRFARDATRSAVRDAVLEQASRRWLFHPKIREALDAFRNAHRAREVARQRKFDEDVSAFHRRYEEGVRSLALRKVRPRDDTNEFFRVGLGSNIGCSLGGSGGFLVTEEEWQFLVLRSFIPKGDGRPTYRHHAIFERLKRRKLIRPGFQYIKPELEEAMRERNGHFLSPYRAVEAYLNELVARGVLRKVDTYYLDTKVHEKFLDLRGSIERKDRRRAALVARVDKIIRKLPNEETSTFSTNAWLTLPQEGGQSFIDAIEADDESYEQMLAPLGKIEALMFWKGASVTETLGLPIIPFQERELNARRAEQARREAEERANANAKEEALQKAAEERGRM